MDSSLLSHPQIHFEHSPLDYNSPFDLPVGSVYDMGYTMMETYERFVQVGVRQPKADQIPTTSASQTPIQRVNFDYINMTFEGQETLTGFLSCLRSSIDEQEQHFRHLQNFSTKYIAHIDKRQREEEEEEKEKKPMEKLIPEWVGVDWNALDDDNSSSLHIDAINPAKKRQGNLPRSITEQLKSWLREHIDNPYPSEIDKENLLRETGLTSVQLANWFINARRRYITKLTQHDPIRKRAVIKTQTRRGRKKGSKKAK
jgi:hypothetical protein